MDALVVFLIYVLPFLTLGLAGSWWMKRNAIGLEEAQAQGTSRRRRHLFLLGGLAVEEVGARTIKRLLILLALVLFARPGLTQERTMMPVTIDGEQVKIATITYKPTGTGPFPTLIFHHGSTGSGTDPSRFSRTFDPGVLAYWFLARGWAVVLPSRRGCGGSEGLYDEGFSRIRASGYTCDCGAEPSRRRSRSS